MAPLFRRGRGASSVEDERELLRRAQEAAAIQLEAMKRELADRVQAIRDRERELEDALSLAPPRPAAVALRDDAVAQTTAQEPRLRELPTEDPAERERIEQRLADLREAERLFLRTQAELTTRSEAIAARERILATRERELGADDSRDHTELAELEARLRRLERSGGTQPADDATSFAGGLEALRRRGTRRPT